MQTLHIHKVYKALRPDPQQPGLQTLKEIKAVEPALGITWPKFN